MYNYITKQFKGGLNMEWANLILKMLILVIIVVVVYNLLKVYVLDKIKINKWIVLALAFLFFILPSFFVNNEAVFGSWGQYVFSGIFVVLFMWFLDLAGLTNRKVAPKKSTGKYYENKPKAKPERVNKSNMEVISNKNSKKKIFKNK